MRIRSSRQTSQARVPLRLGAPPGSSQDPQINLDVSRVRWRDLFALRSVEQRVLFGMPARTRSTGQPVLAGLRQLTPLLPADDRVFVARADRRPVGYAVFVRRDSDGRWLLEGIGANLGVYELEPVWEKLVRFGVIAAGLEGAKRLYARAPVGAEVSGALRSNGFAPYAREQVLSAPMLTLGQKGARVRWQQPSDVWAIHQLYMSTVPQPVQAAEALTSHAWEIRPRRSQQPVQSGWIVDDGYHVAAYARCQSWNDSHILEFMVDDHHREVFSHLISGVLADLAAMPARQVTLLVRNYQQEFIAPMMELGFREQIEQELYVKYTTATARASLTSVVSFTQDVKEPKATRAPTFLKGSSGRTVSESSQ